MEPSSIPCGGSVPNAQLCPANYACDTSVNRCCYQGEQRTQQKQPTVQQRPIYQTYQPLPGSQQNLQYITNPVNQKQAVSYPTYTLPS